MGRGMPTSRLGVDRRREVELALAVDDALARLGVAGADAVPVGGSADGVAAPSDTALVEALITELNGAVNGAAGPGDVAPIVPIPHQLPPINLQLVGLDGLEVTQEVQDTGHSVPLVAGKATIVRAYLRFPVAVEVRGELMVSRSAGGPWTAVPSLGTARLDPSRTGSTLAQLRTRRGDLAFGLNFRLPAAFTTQGPLFLRIGTVRRATGTALPSIAGASVRSVTFQRSATLRVRLVRIRYTQNSRTFEPSNVDATLFASWLRRAYPCSRLQLTTSTVTAQPAAPFNASLINAQLIALRAVDVSTGTDARTHYYGMVSDGGFFMRGLASGIPNSPAPGTVASGPTGPGTMGWDTDGSYGDWYGGHELAHTFGRLHAEFCGALGGGPYPFPNGQLSGTDEAFVGIDVGDPALGRPMRLMGAISSHDVMTYCSNQWISSFTYNGIYQRLVAEDALPAGAGGGPEGRSMDMGTTESGAGPAGVRVIAAVNMTTSAVSITAVIPAGTDPTGTDQTAGYGAPDGPDARHLAIRVRDAGGEVLDEWPAAFRRSSCADPDEDVTGVLDEVVPMPAGTGVVEVLLDGAVADRRDVGGSISASGSLAPGLEGLDADRTSGGGLHLVWDVPDAPAGQRYAVQLSDDGGTSWRTVAVDLPAPEVELPGTELASASGETLTARILATTGLASTVVSTDTVAVR